MAMRERVQSSDACSEVARTVRITAWNWLGGDPQAATSPTYRTQAYTSNAGAYGGYPRPALGNPDTA